MNSVFIVGASRSGQSAALLAKKKGFEKVFVSESKEASRFQDVIKSFEQEGIEFEFGKNSPQILDGFDLVVVSPGVPPYAEIVQYAKSKGKAVISEVEFASWFISNPIIGVTGTNGKTTTTSLIAYLLNYSGLRAHPCGNIGVPISSVVENVNSEDILVVELSSYQLSNIERFHPDVAIILNITYDHIAYHGSFESYKEAKYNIFKNQDEKDLLILNFDDQETFKAKYYAKTNVVYFSLNEVEKGAYVRNGKIFVRNFNGFDDEFVTEVINLSIPGVHNLYNSLAAILSTLRFGVDRSSLASGLLSFPGVEHRLEFVRQINGVDFINDSKSTNIDSAFYALQSYDKPIVWIAGGRADSNDYSVLDDLIEKKVKAIVAIGEERKNIFVHFCDKVRCFVADTLEDAVQKAFSLSCDGDVVLFSPACKSFDMFENFEHRGRVFKEIAMNLK